MLIVWLKFQPRLPDLEPKERIGKKLLEEFNDVSQMGRVEFSRINPESGEIESLVLIRDKERSEWLIPQMSNFPAENAEQVAKVVAPLIQLTVLDVIDAPTNDTIAKTDRFHRECGLLSPSNFILDLNISNSNNLSNGSALSVKIENENNETLVSLLVGNRVPDSAATRDARYVRFPNDDTVYIVDFSGDSTQEQGTTEFVEFPNRVSFNPVDWIDNDLLRISRWDVLYMTLRDYSFSLIKSATTFEQTQIEQQSIAVFKQTPENSLSRAWSLQRFLEHKNSWIENKSIIPDNAQSSSLNETIDILCSLKVLDVRKKPESLSSCFNNNSVGTSLTPHTGALGEFGFSFFDTDPLEPENIEPMLVGEGGSVELVTKAGIKITLIFGKCFNAQRACLAFAKFDQNILKETTEDESEIVFISQETQTKAIIKNQRFANWFYLISEEEYQKINFHHSETLKHE